MITINCSHHSRPRFFHHLESKMQMKSNSIPFLFFPFSSFCLILLFYFFSIPHLLCHNFVPYFLFSFLPPLFSSHFPLLCYPPSPSFLTPYQSYQHSFTWSFQFISIFINNCRNNSKKWKSLKTIQVNVSTEMIHIRSVASSSV